MAAVDVGLLALHGRATRLFTRGRGIELDAAQETPVLVVEGWAARVGRSDVDVRRLLSLILPGDVLHPVDEQATRIVALTDVILRPGPDLGESHVLDRVYQASRRRDTAHVLAQIARVGCMVAGARLLDLFAELGSTLELAGVADGRAYAMPLTRRMVADVLALTSVHVNRTARRLREEGRLLWADGRAALLDAPGAEELGT